jgi:hypothetical protein
LFFEFANARPMRQPDRTGLWMWKGHVLRRLISNTGKN